MMEYSKEESLIAASMLVAVSFLANFLRRQKKKGTVLLPRVCQERREPLHTLAVFLLTLQKSQMGFIASSVPANISLS